MAGSRNEPLSKEEQEAEELRNELLNFGCSDKNLGLDEMRNLLGALKESKETCKNVISASDSSSLNDSKCMPSTSESSNHSSNMPIPSYSYRNAVISDNLKTQSPEKELNNMPIPSYSYKNAVISDNLKNQSPEKELNNKENNSEPALSQTLEKSLSNQISSPDNESIYNGPNLSSNDYPPIRTRGALKSSMSELMNSRLRPRDNKKAIPAAKQKLLERWRFDPFEYDKQRNIPLEKSEPLQVIDKNYTSYNVEDFINSKKFEELCQEMEAEMDCLQVKCSLDAPKNYIWGTPIKVATKWNGSLDKHPFINKSPQFSHSQGASTGDIHDRASKRKALCTIAAVTHDNSNENDENSEDEFINTKKRKCQQGKKGEEAAKKNQESQEIKDCVNNVEMIDVDDSKDFLSIEYNNSIQHNEFKSTKSLFNSEATKDQSEYPRRVTPPVTPSVKKNFKGPRSNKKKNANQSQKTITAKRDHLCDDEISKTLDEIDKEINDDCVDITDDEIKPLSVSMNMQNKLQMARSHLTTVNDTEKQRIKTEEEIKKQKEREEKLKKDELLAKRLQDEEDKNSRETEKERRRKEQGIFYKEILNTNSSSRVTRQNFKPRQNYEQIEEDILLRGDDDEPKPTHTNLDQKNSLCPICCKSFSNSQIERHASECNAFSSESDEISNNQPSTSYSSSDFFECQICNNFRTSDGYRYDDHTISCKSRADDKKNGTHHDVGIH